jgi:long-chain acyl-CoA synthetase
VRDSLFEQVMLIGEGKPYLSVMAVLNQDQWQKFAAEQGKPAEAASARDPEIERALLERLSAQMRQFPGYAQVRRISATLEPWTVENGMLTPTMKLRRSKVMDKFQVELDQMYTGH